MCLRSIGQFVFFGLFLSSTIHVVLGEGANVGERMKEKWKSVRGDVAISDHAKHVNPMIGTAEAGEGHTYPAAIVPLGMVQVGPDTGRGAWKYCAGYRYEDTSIIGFSHTHLSGTGCVELGDLRFMPFTGEVKQEKYQSRFSHADEKAMPGYYSVFLSDYEVKAEMTATAHGAMHRYSFKNSSTARLLIDLEFGLSGGEGRVIRSQLQKISATELSGYLLTKGWGGYRHIYFKINFKQPISDLTWLTPKEAVRKQQVVLTFTGSNNVEIEAKVALSTVDIAGAQKNLQQELPDWDFERVKSAAYNQWNGYFSKIDIEGTDVQKEIFYTALYHTLVAPNNIADVDGRYRGVYNEIATSSNKVYYSTLSIWDIFRAHSPLYTILWPNRTKEMVETMLQHSDVKGYLPVWTLWGHENNCMIGNHSIPMITDAYLKGICTENIERAYEAMKVTSTVNHLNADWNVYDHYGYLPSDVIDVESVSRTLEFGIDDWCLAQMAKKLGKMKDYEKFTKRSQYYRNLYDESTGLMRGKNADGSWVDPFDPIRLSHAATAGGDYTEGNAWQYTWHVLQDPYGLIQLMGGDQSFTAKLDKLFTLPSTVYGDGEATVGVTGLIGQYAQGNEPVHHVAYLYNYVGMPWKTAERVREILSTFYNNTPGGLCGNDDCGQMSAWYAVSVLGFYPVNPANGIYVLGSPSLDKATIHLDDGKVFTIETVKKTEKDIYIDHVEMNGKAWTCSYFRHSDILAGGTLKVFMSDKPNYEFGRLPASRPPLK